MPRGVRPEGNDELPSKTADGRRVGDELADVGGSVLVTKERAPIMGMTTITTVLNVADHELAVAWYSDLFGREPDRRPMEPSAEWQLTETSALMVYAEAETTGGSTLIIGVDRPRRRGRRAVRTQDRPGAVHRAFGPVPPGRAHRPVRQHRHLRPDPPRTGRLMAKLTAPKIAPP